MESTLPTTTTTTTSPQSPHHHHPHPHITTHKIKLLSGLSGITIGSYEKSEQLLPVHSTKITSLDHRGDPPRGTRSDDPDPYSKCLHLRVGDILMQIDSIDLQGLSLEDVKMVADRVRTKCVLIVGRQSSSSLSSLTSSSSSSTSSSSTSSSPTSSLSSTTSSTSSTTTLREPVVIKYRIAESYGYFRFDFKEFLEFFRRGNDTAIKSLRADWNRAKYFLNGDEATSMSVWMEKCSELVSHRKSDLNAVIRMSTQAILGHPCHWLHLLYGRKTCSKSGIVVCNGKDAMEVYLVSPSVSKRGKLIVKKTLRLIYQGGDDDEEEEDDENCLIKAIVRVEWGKGSSSSSSSSDCIVIKKQEDENDDSIAEFSWVKGAS